MKWIFILSLLIGFQAQANSLSSAEIAKEVESLYNSLPANDSSRMPMTLKLADLLFDASVEVDKTASFSNEGQQKDAGQKEAARMEQNRKKAIGLYESALTGLNGQFPRPEKALAARIQYQLARLYTDDGRFALADSLWEKLSTQNEVMKIQREASLRLAEKLELQNNPAPIRRASNLYSQVLKTCDSDSLCSYVTYRKSWAEYRLGLADSAQDFLLQALAKADKQSQAEMVKDLILFSAHTTHSAEKTLALIQKMGEKHQRPQITDELADAYWTADENEKFTYVLTEQNKKDPKLDRYIKILEQKYAFKKPEMILQVLVDAEKALQKNVGFSVDAKKLSSEKDLFRLVIQLDGDRISKTEFTEVFSRAALFYAAAFPQSENFIKVADGWLAAQKDDSVRMNQLAIWIPLQNSMGAVAVANRLSDIRFKLAAKNKNFAVLRGEATGLMAAQKDSLKNREYQYQLAKADYDEKNFAAALPKFQALAQWQTSEKPDEWALFSQNLALDILAQQKKYDQVVVQAQTWISASNLQTVAQKDKAFQKELSDMQSILEKAQFEKAVANQNAEALAQFMSFCSSQKLTPQSCQNAQALAVKLKDQNSLIAILKMQNQKPELASELEFGGYFQEAADLLQKNLSAKNTQLIDFVKVALLYEISGDLKQRDQVLKSSMTFAKALKTFGEQEALYFETLKDAEMLGQNTLAMKWSKNTYGQHIVFLETKGQGNKETQKYLMAQCENLGPVWETAHLNHLKTLNEKQAQIQFVGKNSQAQFSKRVNALKDFSVQSECYLNGASYSQRAHLLAQLEESYRVFANEILSTPLPEGLTDDMIEQVSAQLNEMAQPFVDKSGQYANLKNEQMQRLPAQAKVDLATWNFAIEKPALASTQKALTDVTWQPLIQKMQKNPYEKSVLEEIQAHFETKGNNRLAAYFKGRKETLKKE